MEPEIYVISLLLYIYFLYSRTLSADINTRRRIADAHTLQVIVLYGSVGVAGHNCADTGRLGEVYSLGLRPWAGAEVGIVDRHCLYAIVVHTAGLEACYSVGCAGDTGDYALSVISALCCARRSIGGVGSIAGIYF